MWRYRRSAVGARRDRASFCDRFARDRVAVPRRFVLTAAQVHRLLDRRRGRRQQTTRSPIPLHLELAHRASQRRVGKHIAVRSNHARPRGRAGHRGGSRQGLAAAWGVVGTRASSQHGNAEARVAICLVVVAFGEPAWGGGVRAWADGRFARAAAETTAE